LASVPYNLPNHIDLAAKGVGVYVGKMEPHDYLWFASTDANLWAAILPLLHNIALTFSLSQRSRVLSGTVPCYQEDLASVDLYAVPAEALGLSRASFTQNAVDEKTLRTDTGVKLNTPALSRRVTLAPSATVGSDDAPGFAVAVFSRNGAVPPARTRLGKKGAAVRWYWETVKDARATRPSEPWTPDHPVNPLDLLSQPKSYEPVALPPHLLYRRATLHGDYRVLARSGGSTRQVHVPVRVLNWMNLNVTPVAQHDAS
jgi:CRISPR type I-D-associated protein Csc1